jgi:hypothetical protein
MIKSMCGIAILSVCSSLGVVTNSPENQEPISKIPLEKNSELKSKILWKCPECTPNEQVVLTALQEHTKISDRNALATIMGNIQQESKFISNICEGGARVSYTECRSGGFGLIQWTSIGRYKGLGNFCAKYQCDPSSLEGQVRWMINEPIFQRVLPQFEGGGQTVSYYMRPAYVWLGWGIKGNRELYAYDYTKKIILV